MCRCSGCCFRTGRGWSVSGPLQPPVTSASNGAFRQTATSPCCGNEALCNRHSPDSRSAGCDFPSRRGTLQRNSIAADPLTANMVRRSVSQGRNLPLFRDQGAPLPSSSVASAPISRSCWRGRCPQPGDQRQDVGKHLLRHRHLGHLKRNVAPVADDLRTDLDQLLAQAGQRPRLRGLRHR